jgi:hypothetical protein
MRFSMEMKRFVTVLAVVSICVVNFSCAFISDLTSKATETNVFSPISTEATATQPIQATEEPIPTESIPTEGPISTSIPSTQGGPIIPERNLGSGPWLLIEAGDGLWAVNPDGSGLTLITEEVPTTRLEIAKAVSPEGGHFAYITSDGPTELSNLTLKYFTLPMGTVETIARLTSEQTEPDPDAMPGDPAFEVARAIAELHNLAWSPDGELLAFMGAMNGPSSDLYVYSIVSGEITQLTDGPSQGIRPMWSPDGEYIVHAGVSSLGTGAGYGMQGIWAAKPDGSDVLDLYPIPGDSGDEIFLGWVSPNQFLVYTWSVVCGTKNLCTYDLISGKTEVLWEDFFSSAALSPVTGHVLLSVDEWTADCNPDKSEGMFLLNPGGAVPLKVLGFGNSRFDWYPSAGVFLVNEESKMFAVWPEGEVRSLVDAPGAELPSVSPDGRLWAFGEMTQSGVAGLWLGEFGGEVERIVSESARSVIWSPGGEGLFFFGNAGLYFAPSPSYEPVLIGPGLESIYEDPATWVWP